MQTATALAVRRAAGKRGMQGSMLAAASHHWQYGHPSCRGLRGRAQPPAAAGSESSNLELE